MTIEHRIALVTSIPCIEGIMRQNQTDTIPNVLLLVVLDFNELVAEVIVMKELIIVVSQNKVLLPLQVLQQVNRGLCVIAGDVPKNENMVGWLDYGVPVVREPVVIVLWTVQFIMRESKLIGRPPYGICVCLITKMHVRYVKVVNHCSDSFQVFTQINVVDLETPSTYIVPIAALDSPKEWIVLAAEVEQEMVAD